MTEKLDMFEVLREIDARNTNFLSALPEDQKKQFVPLLSMRWLSSGTERQTRLLNAVVNPMVFSLHRHPELLYKLMVATSDGKSRRYSWIKKKGKDKSSPVSTAVVSEYYQCSKKDAKRYLRQLTQDDVFEMADELGYDKDQVKKLKAEFK